MTERAASKKRKREAPVAAAAEEADEARLDRQRALYRNKQHTLVLSSRGITSRQRHLLTDLRELLPHCKKEVKFDAKATLGEINEIAEYRNCGNVIFFECRKHQDLYLWLVKAPHGPSVKFHVTNIHTMSELKFAGNSLRGSRPVLSFDANFETSEHLRVMKQLIEQAFGTPYMHPRSRPFIDHVLAFYWLDDRIWVRNYQIADEYVKEKAGKNKTEEVLVEMGPRFVMQPIKILDGSFGGPLIYENAAFVSPNAVRARAKAQKVAKYPRRIEAEAAHAARVEANVLPKDELDFVFQDDNSEDAMSED